MSMCNLRKCHIRYQTVYIPMRRDENHSTVPKVLDQILLLDDFFCMIPMLEAHLLHDDETVMRLLDCQEVSCLLRCVDQLMAFCLMTGKCVFILN